MKPFRQNRRILQIPRPVLFLLAVIVAVSVMNRSLFRAASTFPHSSAVSARTQIPVRLIKVNDGDTITVEDHDGKQIRIRFYGIDCPELEQFYGPEAKSATESFLFNRQLSIEPRDTDPYGRTVAMVYADKICVNESLLYAGDAWWYRHFAKYEVKFSELERVAREGKRGLWAYPNPEPPWDWRVEHPRE